MADVVNSTPAAEASSPKKAAKKTAKAKASHPPTAVMVTSAVKNLKERGGSSLQAIKKYIASTYKVDAEKLAPFIRKFIKASVVSGALVQTKGKGASGSFKLASATNAPAAGGATKVAKKSTAKKSPKKPKAKTAADKPAAVKKAPAKRAAPKAKSPVVEKKKPVAKAKPKSPVKAKKVAAKSPTRKPKAPKPKTTKAKAAAKSPKKTAAKRK